MYAQVQDGVYQINGRVRPPLVLRSEAELFIAQNAHNLVWQTAWNECSDLDLEIQRLRRSGGDPSAAEETLKRVIMRVETEIDTLVKAEIDAYRASRGTVTPLQELEARVETLERQVRRLCGEVADAQDAAQEAMDGAENAQSMAQEALEAAQEEDT